MANWITNVIVPEVKTYRMKQHFAAENNGEQIFNLRAGDTVTGQIVDTGIYGTPLQRGIQVRKPNGTAIHPIIPIDRVDIDNPVSDIDWYLYGGLALAAAIGIYFITKK